MEHLPEGLRALVHQSVRILGDVIRHELGDAKFQRIDRLREKMTALRPLTRDEAIEPVREAYRELEKLSPNERLEIAQAFTLMLEVMNACENAYRSHRIAERKLDLPKEKPDSVVYVLTAHPTEARSPDNIAIFHAVLNQLIPVFRKEPVELTKTDELKLRHSLELAWKTSVTRVKKPRVQDEADHIFSTALRDETLSMLLQSAKELAPLYIRSWVGGDKDGHPGVDEVVFVESLGKSRKLLLHFVQTRLRDVERDLERIQAAKPLSLLKRLQSDLKMFSRLTNGEGKKLVAFRRQSQKFADEYVKAVGVLHPNLVELKTLLHLFPALVVPLEFRESSDVLMSDPSGKSLAIFRMLKKLAEFSRGTDPRWYVRGFIVSMTNEIAHLEMAASFVQKALKSLKLPVIPLFEQASALSRSSEIFIGMLKSPLIGPAIRGDWDRRVELMLGYSDSSKESGVLRSRLQVAEAMTRLDKLAREQAITPIFFQGSGGSTDRGGGSIEEQTSWWPAGALRNYKVTVQGEMIERSLASPEITRGQIEKIVQSAGRWNEVKDREFNESAALRAFADSVAKAYQDTVHDEKFLEVIGKATPYSFLDMLKIGSRPTKRATSISVEGLRAIPWILCWTQTRTLFPTWWGIGTAWRALSKEKRADLKKEFETLPVFRTYVRALGYTLAKVRLSLWRVYLDESGLEESHADQTYEKFCEEFDGAIEFATSILGSKSLVSWRPWLEESIHLRSPMIHPLNLMQILAMKDRDEALLRVTVTGISSGMMATG